MNPHVDTSSITWLGLSTLAALIGGIWWRMHLTGESLFDVVNGLFKRQKLSIIMAVIIILNLAEAMMAASLVLSSQKYSLNLVARFIGHISISAASLACALLIGDTMKHLIQAIKGLNFGATLLRLFRLTIVVGFAFLLPVFNAAIISNGLHETASCRLWLASINPFSSQGYYMYLLAKGNPAIGPGPLTIQYEPWDSLSYPMVTTLGITIIHIVFLLLDLTFVSDMHDASKASNEKEEAKGEKEEAKTGAKGEEGEGEKDTEVKTSNAFEEGLVKVMKFYGLSGDQLKTKYAACQKIIVAQSPGNSSGIADRVHSTLVLIEAFEKANYDAAKAATERNKILEAIKKMFEASPANGLGFGISLPKPKN